jgi:hypothetical protein
MTITYQKDSNILQDYSTATKLTKNDNNSNIYYISICDSAYVDINSENTYSIGLQGREVI